MNSSTRPYERSSALTLTRSVGPLPPRHGQGTSPLRFGGLQLPRLLKEMELAHVASYATAAPPVLDRMLALPASKGAKRAAALTRTFDLQTYWGEAYHAARSHVETWATLPEADIELICTTLAPSRNPRLELGKDMHPVVRSEDRALYEVCVPTPEQISHKSAQGLQSTLARIFHAGEALSLAKDCVRKGEQPRTARLLGAAASGLAFAVSDSPETYNTPPLTYVTMCRRALGLPPPPDVPIPPSWIICHGAPHRPPGPMPYTTRYVTS